MGKILVVDDDIEFRESCYGILSRDGHHVLTYPFGSKLLQLVHQERPDLLLADCENPAGLELLKSLQAHSEWKVPGAAFVSQTEPDMEKKIYQAGALDIFLKSATGGDFCQRVGRLLSVKHRIFNEAQEIRGAKILVVDDEEPIRQMLMFYFEKKGFRVYGAESGEKALLLAEKENPGVVLLDITMPGMDGILTLKKLREKKITASVIIASSVPDEKIMAQACSLGACAYVLKPFDVAYLEFLVAAKLLTSG